MGYSVFVMTLLHGDWSLHWVESFLRTHWMLS